MVFYAYRGKVVGLESASLNYCLNVFEGIVGSPHAFDRHCIKIALRLRNKW